MVFFPLVTTAQSTVQGTVSQAETTTGLLGIKVVIDNNVNYMTATDTDGNYIIKNVPGGEHTIEFTGAGFDTLKMEMEVKSSAPVNYLNAKMKPTPLENVYILPLIYPDPKERELDEVVIVYVKPENPTTYKTLKAKEIEKINYGQDLPYLLQMTPSTVVTLL